MRSGKKQSTEALVPGRARDFGFVWQYGCGRCLFERSFSCIHTQPRTHSPRLDAQPPLLPEKSSLVLLLFPAFSLPLLQRGLKHPGVTRQPLVASIVVRRCFLPFVFFCSVRRSFFWSWSCVLTAAATQPPSRGRSKGGANGSDGQGGATHQRQDWSVILAAGGAPPWRNYCAGCTRRHMSPKRQRPSRKLLQTSSIFSTCDHTPTRIQI